MEYAARLPRIPSRRTFVAPLVALVVGAGVATGVYALVDDSGTTGASKVIVVEQPAQGSSAIPGKNEATTAAAISHTGTASIPGKNEATTAAAITQGGIEPRGSKASATNQQSFYPGPAAAEQRSDPHGTAIDLRNP
jgi:hypothetical protein